MTLRDALELYLQYIRKTFFYFPNEWEEVERVIADELTFMEIMDEPLEDMSAPSDLYYHFIYAYYDGRNVRQPITDMSTYEIMRDFAEYLQKINLVDLNYHEW